MKRFSNACRRQRESLCLLASGLLPKQDRAAIENHLVQCADCRGYYDEIKAVTTPLAGWEKRFAHIETGTAVRTILVNATQAADRQKSIRRLRPWVVALECWRQLILPSRWVWTGLALVWMVLLAVNVSVHSGPQTALAKTVPTTEMISSFRQQQKILAELIGPNEWRGTVAPKPFPPQPRSEGRFEILTV